ncbi:sodium- and chloride-dependent glycine transporter 1 [Nasonia vitripennis]|uniref:Transporter n=1 Tax=Nasonia vitripennis TaxID=7425 RepID=A0A7M7QJL6_NASVI|nr:sodium- and chloride-dependent glycine transporter 1 [Nasonia vitripennis]
MSVLFEFARTTASLLFRQAYTERPDMAKEVKEKPKRAKRLSLGVGGALVELPADERQGWANPLEFVLSCIGYAVGIGNVWRFPYLVYRNGGGAFLIPFVLMLLTMGLPIFFLELIVGQYVGLGPTEAYARMAPAFQGLGYCTIVVIALVTIYYMVIISWTLFYTFASFSSKLAWAYCDNEFNSPNCYSSLQDAECRAERPDLVYYNRSCMGIEAFCRSFGLASNLSDPTHCYKVGGNGPGIELRHLYNRTLSSEEFYNDYVLGIRDAKWEDWGGMRWELLGCISLAWLVCYLCLIKGIQSVGKVVYFTALFPYFVLIAFMIRGATLEGAVDGILWYISPRWSYLMDARVWADAASQVFYSLGIGCGSLVTLASYSSFSNNCHRDAVFVTLTNLLTSVFAGFVTFSVMGFLMNQMNLPIEEVVRSETGLAFIVYPEAVVQMPLSNLWAVLFFLMLFILGLGSQFAGVQAISCAIMDVRPDLRPHESRVILVVCALGWLLSLPMLCNGGIYLFTLMDWNTASWAVLLIGFAELVLPAWFYGCGRLLHNLAEMQMNFGPLLRAYWRLSWTLLAPATCLGVFIYQMYTYRTASFGDYKFPVWADVIGILIGLSTLAPMPIFFCYHLWRGPRDWSLLKPSSSWGPAKKASTPERSSSTASVDKQQHEGGVSNPAFLPDSQA